MGSRLSIFAPDPNASDPHGLTGILTEARRTVGGCTLVRTPRSQAGGAILEVTRLVRHARALGVSALAADVLDERHPAHQFARAAGCVGISLAGLMRRLRLDGLLDLLP